MNKIFIYAGVRNRNFQVSFLVEIMLIYISGHLSIQS